MVGGFYPFMKRETCYQQHSKKINALKLGFSVALLYFCTLTTLNN